MDQALSKPPPSAPIPGLEKGRVLANKYELEYEIGRGAMGTVWAAMHRTLDQRVAIKVISAEHAGSDELRRRFRTEAKAAARLRSRYVVGVYDDGITKEGLPFIVLEYLEGECLEDRITREGTIHLQDTVRIAKHVGRALGRAHGSGIIHRDLKPANVFITHTDDDDEGWIAKVLDFGIAKMEGYGSEKSTTKAGTVLGTPLFMSPEQVRGASAVDARADLYSLGMVVYNMLTGGYAFDGTSFGDLLVSICTDPLPKIREAAPWLPEEVEDWFQKACARDPDARFQSADEMIAALHEAASVTITSRFSTASLAAIHVVPGSSVAATQPGASPATLDSPNPKPGLSSSSPSTVTVNEPPRSKLPIPWIAGAGALLLAAGVTLTLIGGRSEPAPNAATGTAAPDTLNQASSTAAPTPEDTDDQNVEEPPPDPDGTATTGDGSEDKTTETPTADKTDATEAATDQSDEKPTALKATTRPPPQRPVWKPRPTPKAPTKPAPTKTSPDSIDLGF